MPQVLTMSSVLSPIDNPVRGSAIPGSTGRKCFQAQSEPGTQAFAERLAAVALQQQLLEALRVDHGRIAHGIDARGNGAVDLAERDLVAEQNRRFQAGAAGALQIESRRLRGEARAEHRLARQVPLARMLHHRAGGDVVQALSLQPVSAPPRRAAWRSASLDCPPEHRRRCRVRTECVRRRRSRHAVDCAPTNIGLSRTLEPKRTIMNPPAAL